MNNNERPSFFKGKGAAVGIVICFVAVIGLVGVYTFSNYRKEINEQMAKAEEEAEQLTEDNTEETTADDILLPESEDDTEKSSMAEDENEYGETDGAAGGTDSGQSGESSGTSDGTALSGADTSGVWFGEDSVLAWPASGAVIMGYSMDQTVFFQTLDQYQYNPAMIIGGEVGETIAASAAGIVTSIDETAQTGTTVTLDMGNGYTATYGQLADVPVAVGDYVAAGASLGTLSEPTKYYSVEGPNLYFEIQKDGQPVDPMNFME